MMLQRPVHQLPDHLRIHGRVGTPGRELGRVVNRLRGILQFQELAAPPRRWLGHGKIGNGNLAGAQADGSGQTGGTALMTPTRSTRVTSATHLVGPDGPCGATGCSPSSAGTRRQTCRCTSGPTRSFEAWVGNSNPLSLVFIGPNGDEIFETRLPHMWWKEEVERDLFPLLQSPIGMHVKEAPTKEL